MEIMKKTRLPIESQTRRILQLIAILFAGFAATNSLAQDTHSPPGVKPQSILKGVTKSSSFSKSAIFPGTVRNVSVFIPAQYDGSKPGLCLCQDRWL